MRSFCIPGLAAVTLLAGCWNFPDGGELDTVAFDNAIVNTQTGVIETIETNLECPDGEKARLYVVYDQSITAAAPVAIVFHSSTFDYVTNPQPEAPLVGTNYAGSESRISWSWAVRKVWETFGMHDAVDPAESNLGTLPAALLDAGVVGIYPINCWADLWHNEQGLRPNDLATEYIDRNGGAFAWWMVRMLFEADFADLQGITINPLIDLQRMYWIGLGDGSRAVIDLLGTRDVGPVGVLLDSPIDDLEMWGDQSPQVAEGLARVYNPTRDSEFDWREWELRYMWNRAVSAEQVEEFPAMGDIDRLAVIHSTSDPQVPNGNLERLTNSFANTTVPNAPDVCAIDTGRVAHVFSNGDQATARELVDYLVNGTRPANCD
ncbi:MAG: hypothetical protein H6739_31815 [Alphaproteobacteria bacterium]|nr:hypothetical protein [Alphaproteobacteria bacterium]